MLGDVFADGERSLAPHLTPQLKAECAGGQAAVRVDGSIPRIGEGKAAESALVRYEELVECGKLGFVQQVELNRPLVQYRGVVTKPLLGAVQKTDRIGVVLQRSLRRILHRGAGLECWKHGVRGWLSRH